MQNNNININKLDINEKELINFNFESIITLEELLTYFFDQNVKLKKVNYISFFKIFHFYQMNKSLNLIFLKDKYLLNLFEKLFKLQFISIILDEIFLLENNINEKKIMMIKECLILNHQNFLVLSYILIEILQFCNMTNLYHNKINKVIYEKLIDNKLYSANNISNIKDLTSKIEQNNKDVEYKIKIIIEKENIKNFDLFDIYNKLNEINSEEACKYILNLLGLNNKEISEINISLKEDNNKEIIKSVKVPFLFPLNNNENYALTVIIDLDGTLIYNLNNEEENFEEEDEENEEENEIKDNIIIRPGLYEFLDILLKLKCELILFTSSTKQRADEIINIIEKNKKYFNKRLYREHCVLIGAAYVKDISKLGRDLNKTIIIDNDLGCFYLQQENGILIKSFIGNEDDKNLLNLSQILGKIIKSPFYDIRTELDKYKEQIKNTVTN